MMKAKYVVVGDVNGKFAMLFKRLQKLAVKFRDQLDLLICVGRFFGTKDEQWEMLINGEYKIPTPVYILGPTTPEEREFYPEDLNSLHEFKPNLIYLGKVGRYRTHKGMSIAFLSGKESKTENDRSEMTHSMNDIKMFQCANDEVLDIVVTTAWPSNRTELQSVPIDPTYSSDAVAELLGYVKPWYHFCSTSNKFLEPAPYVNTVGEIYMINITRFIGLASATSGEKWFYGVIYDLPRKITEQDKKAPFVKSPYHRDTTYQRYDVSAASTSGESGKRRKGEEESSNKRKDFDSDDCWFCLRSHKSENHLVVLLKSQSYIALNKGGIVEKHLNIIPVHHIPSINLMPETGYEDVKQLKFILKKHFSKEGLEVIFYERYHKCFHALLHCVPVKSELIPHAKRLFEEKIRGLNLEFKYLIDSSCIKEEVAPEGSYFYAEFPNGEVLLTHIKDRFPLNFAREVLCDESVLNCPNRVDWKKCTLTVVEEKDIVEELRQQLN